MNILVPTALRKFTDGLSTLNVEADTVGDALQKVMEMHPDLRPHVLDEKGHVVSFLGVFVNDQNIRDLDDEETAVRPYDEILLVPALAGG